MRLITAVRAALAFAAGIVITFSQSHAAAIGLAVFAAYALTLAPAQMLWALFNRKYREIHKLRNVATSLVAGFAALAGIWQNQSIYWLLFTVGLWSVANAVGELAEAKQAAKKSSQARDANLNAGLYGLLALCYLFIGLDEKAAVGFLGAFFVIYAVHQALAAASETAK